MMALECVMAFGPTGVMMNDQIVESLRDAPRWSNVTMSDKAETHPTKEVAVLAYVVRGERDGAEPYRAICTSTYICVDGYWWIAQHQQTPLG